MIVKGVVFYLESGLSSKAKFLLEDFRLAVNNAVRAGLLARVTSRNALCRLAYKDFRKEHPKVWESTGFPNGCGVQMRLWLAS